MSMRYWQAFRVAICLLLSVIVGAAHGQSISHDQLASALSGLEAMANKTIETGGVPGLAIAVVHNDRLIYLKGFGVREAGKPELVDGDTVFQLASLSKPITSSVIAVLVGEGLLDWDSRIADLDTSFQLYDAYPTAQVTIRDMLAHRSGLPGTADDELEDIGYGRSDELRKLRLVPPSSSFRAG